MLILLLLDMILRLPFLTSAILFLSALVRLLPRVLVRIICGCETIRHTLSLRVAYENHKYYEPRAQFLYQCPVADIA